MALQVYPPSIEFADIEIGIKYVISFCIQNKTNKARRIRFDEAETSAFKLLHTPSGIVAPGLDLVAEIEFKPTELRDYKDRIVINSEGTIIEIPLRGYIPVPKFNFNSMVEMGKIVMGNKASSVVEIRNVGVVGGDYTLKWTKSENDPLSITPFKGFIAPRGKTTPQGDDVARIRIEWNSKEVGNFSTVVTITSTGQPDMFFTVNAIVCEHKVQLLLPDGGGTLDKIYFGSIFFGDTRKVTAILVNNGPLSCGFNILSENDQNEGGEEGEREGGGDNNNNEEKEEFPTKSMSVFPRGGILQPYSQTPIVITFNPIMNGKIRGFKSDPAPPQFVNYAVNYVIDCQDISQSIQLPCTGKGIRSEIEISKKSLSFGDCPMGERLDLAFQLKNCGLELPFEYQISKLVHFAAKPSKGRLSPGQSVTIEVTFYPSQLGKFTNVMHCVINNGIVALPINVHASSTTVSKESNHARTQNKNPSYVNEGEESSKRLGLKPFYRQLPWEHGEPEKLPYYDRETFSRTSDKPFTFCIQDLESRLEHRDEYNNFLKTSYKHRLDFKTKINDTKTSTGNLMLKKVAHDSINMGLEPYGGINPPKLSLPAVADSLWLERPIDESGAIIGKKKGAVQEFSIDRVFKKKYKTQPTTQAEARDCSNTLDENRLPLVNVGNKNISFGKVCVTSTTVKSFNVTNGLEESILIEITHSCNEIKKSFPSSQVIPPGCSAGFDIIFSSNELGIFKDHFTFSINNKHFYKAMLSAEVIPISLKMSTDSVYLKFASDNDTPSCSERIVLQNPGNCPAEYKWIISDKSCFFISPSNGTILAGGSLDTWITYTQLPKQSTKDFATLEVKNGPQKPLLLELEGEEEKGQLTVLTKNVNFGIIPVGTSKTATCTLQNNSTVPSVYWIEKMPIGMVISPSKGRLNPGESLKLTMAITPTSNYTATNEMVEISVRGGKNVKISFDVVSVMPSVSIMEEEFNFGDVVIGAKSKKIISFRNETAVPTALEIDLSKFSDFDLLFFDMEGDKRSVSTISDEDDKTLVQIAQKKSRILSENENEIGDENDSVDNEKEEVVADELIVGKLFQVNLRPNALVKLFLIFTPTKICNFGFQLPISINGVKTTSSLRRAVVACGLSPLLCLNKTVVDFGKRVISRDLIRKSQYTETLSFKNADHKLLSWEVDISSLKSDGVNGIFTIEPSKGTITAGDIVKIKVTFMPAKDILYNAELPIYINGKTQKSYLELNISGVGMYPNLTFDKNDVFLPPVPLNIQSKAVFYIISTGYDNLDLQYRLPGGSSQIPITLNFPLGKTIGLHRDRVPVEVTFVSKKAMSFTAKIEFVDNEANKFSVTVTGLSDNCMLTTQPFFSQDLMHTIVYGDNNSVPQLLDFNSAALLENKDPLDYKRKKPLSENSRPIESMTSLVKWMNANVVSTALSEVPRDMVAENGKVILDIIETLSGKKVPGRITKAMRPSEVVPSLIKQYTEMLQFLKSLGCLLHQVRPELLLSTEDFIKWFTREETIRNAGTKVQNTPAATLLIKENAEREWNNGALEAWLAIFYQIAKVFVLGRVTSSHFASQPGTKELVDKESPVSNISSEEASPQKKKMKGALEPKLPSSNFLNSSECLLLRWLTIHHNSINPSNTRQIKNFGSDIADGEVLVALFASFVPALTGIGFPLYSKASSKSTDLNVENANKILACLETLGLQYSVSVDAITKPIERDMILFVLYLYEQLPQFVPKTTIEFHGILGQSISKSIQLTNPSKQAITYDVILTGDANFSTPSNVITIEGGKSYELNIQFVSKFSKQVKGRITLKSRKDGGIPAATMVFLLASFIHARKAMSTINCQGITYEAQMIDVPVKNPFTTDCVFQITMVQECFENNVPIVAEEKVAPHVAKARGIDNKNSSTSSSNNQQTSPFPNAFWTKTESIKLKAGATFLIPVQFLPFAPGTYKCQFIFLDDKVGEFLIEVIAEAILPLPMEKIKFTTDMKSMVKQDLFFSPQNKNLENAKLLAADTRLNGLDRTKAKDNIKASLDEKIEPKTFKVEINSPYYSTPPQIILQDLKKVANKAALVVGSGGGSPMDNIYAITFHPRAPGLYPCKLVIRGLNDIRVYEIEALVNPVSVLTQLDFCAPANDTIIQEIPIINNSETNWALRCEIVGDKCFNGPVQFIVPAQGQTLYPISFRPDWVGEYKGSLTLSNSVNGQKLNYNLVGRGEEPLAVEHIVIRCNARDKIIQNFNVVNKNKEETNYTVESDIPHVSGDSSILVPGGATKTYPLKINAVLGGIYAGSITFKDDKGRFQWYTIEIQAESPKEEEILNIEAIVRKAASIEISMTNPLDKNIEFEVALVGNGLFGNPTLTLSPHETATYECIFSPLLPGKQIGSISFVNESVGEFWYQLNLTSLESAPEQLPKLESPIGGFSNQEFFIENPTGELLTLKSENSNSGNFALFPAAITIKPYDKALITVRHTPSSLDIEEETRIIFKSARAGTWVYDVKGVGIMPNFMPQLNIHVAIGESKNEKVVFINPFEYSITIEAALELENPTDRDVLYLLNKKVGSLTLPPLSNIQIPVSFMPKTISSTIGTIIVTALSNIANMGPGFKWKFPVLCTAEAPPSRKTYYFVTKARDSIMEIVELNLPGLPPITSEEKFHFELVVPDENRAIVSKTLSINQLNKSLMSNNELLRFQVRFDPMRPFETTADLLVISTRTGGRWRYPIFLRANEPEIDDIIEIEAFMNKSNSVSFKLSNPFDFTSKFQAYLTVESSIEFNVYPKNGVLSAYGEGNTFTISFTPRRYGKPLNGKLIIETEEMMWSYEIRGVQPQYIKPVGTSVVSTHLDESVEKALKLAHKPKMKKIFSNKNINK